MARNPALDSQIDLFGRPHCTGTHAKGDGGWQRVNFAKAMIANPFDANGPTGYSLRCGLSAPPTASQASVPEVARGQRIML